MLEFPVDAMWNNDVATTSAAVTNSTILEQQQPEKRTAPMSQIEFRKKQRVEKPPHTSVDHDYLPLKTSTRHRSENEEIKVLYEDTVTVLHNINQNVSNVAQNIGELTEQFRNFSAKLEVILENMSKNRS